MMLLIYSLLSIFIAWIWVDYYRLIDIYNKENLKYFILTFFLGAASVLIVIGINKYLLDSYSFHLNGNFINDFLYCFLKIGFVEELAKTIPFVMVYFLFKKEFNEPIDYLAFICISALGFSAAENVLYFNNHGASIIDGRAILSTVGHMFDTSLIAYGIIMMQKSKSNFKVLILLGYFVLAALSHGFYDFWLLFEGTKVVGVLITVLYFLITISLFATILNNALNNSSFFTYKRVVNSDIVLSRLLMYYGIVYVIKFALMISQHDVLRALIDLRFSIILTGFIIIITVKRLSRFKLIKDRWHPLKIEFPFKISANDSFLTSPRSGIFRIQVKGEGYNETYINNYYEEYFVLHPVSQRITYIEKPSSAYIEKKLFLKNDEVVYLARIYLDENKELFETLLIKPKTFGESMVNEKYPIVALIKVDNIADLEDPTVGIKNFKFLEWAYAKPKS